MKELNENISTPVRYEADVVVAGGGFAGIAAALSAARAGASVILLERGFLLGGLATAGLVTIYLPLCDGCGRQVSFGIAEELFRLSIEHGDDGRYPDAWLDGCDEEKRREQRYMVQFNPHFFAISAERELIKAGVKILYGTSIVSVHREDDRVRAVVIEGKSGREAVEVKRSVVDCTGDADVCHMAGAPCRNYGRGNTLAAWYYADNGEGVRLKQLGFTDVSVDSGEAVALGNARYTGLDTEELSHMTVDSHRALERDLLARRAAGEEKLYPTLIASIPQVRMTRGLVGEYVMDVTDDGRYAEDSVGMFANWRRKGPVYELPFRALWSREVKNLLVAGRAMSATDGMWDITRVIPVCAVSGEAAGLAAAMGDDMSALDVSALQEKLTRNGVELHIQANCK